LNYLSAVGRIALLVLGIFSVISLVCMVTSTDEFPVEPFFLSIGLVGLLLWFAMARRIHATSGTDWGTGCLYVVSLGAALVGSGILVGLTCFAFGR
jgi:hypothetical protein